MTVSTLTVAPEALPSGAAPCAEPTIDPWWSRSPDARSQALARAARPDFEEWLRHVKQAAACTTPIRLAGSIEHVTVQPEGRWSYTSTLTANMPDGVIYKPCGNRRASACPSCSKRYQRDAYQIIRTMLVGGRGVPETVSQHPAVFPTFTAPSFGPVHTRVVDKHTCASRRQCDCRPKPCHPDRQHPICPHARRIECYARHDETDKALGTPLCLDCYDHHAQVVWNIEVGELWRRTLITILRFLQRRARQHGIDPNTIKLTYGKAAEFQRRAVIHLHAIMRLDRIAPADPTVILPPAGLDASDLYDAVEHAGKVTSYTTQPHPARPEGWRIGWGEHVHTKVITVAAKGEITDSYVAGYLAKYATKSTEVTGHMSRRLTEETIDYYADPGGTFTERLIDACWTLGRPKEWRRLRLWAHQLGFGSHFLTKSRRHVVTFAMLRNNRIVFRRTAATGPEPEDRAVEQPTTLVVNFLQFVGAGWHTAGDALLANTSAAMARERWLVALEELTTPRSGDGATVKPALHAVVS